MKQRTYEDTVERIKKARKDGQLDRDAIWGQIEDLIYVRDKDGNVEYTPRNKPRINWLRVVFNIGRLVALVEQYTKHEKQ